MNFDSHSLNKLSFFKKYILSVYPDNNNPRYNYDNGCVIYLDNFRKNNFPVLDEIVSNNSFKSFKTNLKGFNKIGNFIIDSKYNNKNFDIFLGKNLKLKKNFSTLYSMYHFIFFLENNFYYFLTHKHFFNVQKRMFTKFNYLFLCVLKKINENSFISTYNLDNIFDWLKFNNSSTINNKLYSNKTNSVRVEDDCNYVTRESVFKKYKVSLRNFFKSASNTFVFNKLFLSDVVINFKNLCVTLLDSNKNVYNTLKINFSESSTNKHIDLSNNFLKRSNFILFFLRKNKIFNKGRYSRNRQTYRTGFYWCLWVNIFAIYGLHYLCYRFTFAFGYLWVPFIIFFISFIFGRMFKYNFHNYHYIVSELKNFNTWVSFILINFINCLHNAVTFYFGFLKNFFGFSTNKNCSVFINYVFKGFESLLVSIKNNLNLLDHVYVWRYLSSEDVSLFRFSSKKFFLTQLFLPL